MIVSFLEQILDKLSSNSNDIHIFIVAALVLAGLVAIFWLLLRAAVHFIGSLVSTFRNISQGRGIPNDVEEHERRLIRRKQFADHIQSEIRRVNLHETWSHNRFTELEAEVEAVGEYRVNSLFFSRRSNQRTEPSLTLALEKSIEPLILVEGDPGSGKSVALRQVALTMARKAEVSSNLSTPIPIYVNLKELDRKKWITERSLTMETSIDTRKLRQILLSYFSLDELKDLCFELLIEYHDLRGDTFKDKCRELVVYCENHRRLWELVQLCISLRPKISLLEEIASDSQAEKTILPINQNLIRLFVLKILKRSNDRDIDEFLEEEFKRGMREGTWIFLFDSFDEIPEVLSSTDADEIIQAYGEAISDFLGGMNRCRGVVASRQYRGPQRLGWPRFRILPLKPIRQEELIRKLGFDNNQTERIVGQINIAEQGIRSMASNPLFLSLLGQHMKGQEVFPENTYTVYQKYINKRLQRDQERLRYKFDLEGTDILAASEKLAFCMTADKELGLSPTRSELQVATIKLGLEIEGDFDQILDALEFLKLARSETGLEHSDSKSFTFSHRRFQEYFATSIVLREPNRITPHQLLTDGRWRETAVVLCQSQPIEALQELVEEALVLISQANRKSLDSFEQLLDTHDQAKQEIFRLKKTYPLPKSFPWTSGILHVLSILQEGFSNRVDELPRALRRNIGQLLWLAFTTGLQIDKKWTLEVAGPTPEPILLTMIKEGFEGRSKVLKQAAYKQAFRLGLLPEAITVAILRMLRAMLTQGYLQQDRHMTRSHLSRFDQAKEFLRALDRLLFVHHIDSLATGFYILFPFLIVLNPESNARIILLLFIIIVLTFLFLRHIGGQIGYPILSFRRRPFLKLGFIVLFFTAYACLVYWNISSQLTGEYLTELTVARYIDSNIDQVRQNYNEEIAAETHQRVDELLTLGQMGYESNYPIEEAIELSPQAVSTLPIPVVADLLSNGALSGFQVSMLSDEQNQELLVEFIAREIVEHTPTRETVVGEAANYNRLAWAVTALYYVENFDLVQIPKYPLLLILIPFLILSVFESTAQILIISTIEKRAIKAFLREVWHKILKLWKGWRAFSILTKLWLIGVFLVTIALLITWMVYLFSQIDTLSVTTQTTETTPPPLVEAIGIGYGIGLILLLLYLLWTYIKDWIRLRVLLSQRRVLEGMDFISNASKFRHGGIRVKYTEAVLRKSLLTNSTKTVIYLEKLVTKLEQLLATQRSKHSDWGGQRITITTNNSPITIRVKERLSDDFMFDLLFTTIPKVWASLVHLSGQNKQASTNILTTQYYSNSDDLDEFDRWYQEYTHLFKFRLVLWGSDDFLDQLCLLLEQIRVGNR